MQSAIRMLSMKALGIQVHPFPASPQQCGFDSYRDRLCAIARDRRTAKPIEETARAALEAMPVAGRIAPAVLIDALGRHQCNVYGVTGPAAAEVALASFTGLFQLFNHSCLPNILFDSVPTRRFLRSDGETAASSSSKSDGWPFFQLVAFTDIPAGAELLHSYARSADGPELRRSTLRDHYGFECDCPRCECDPLREADIAAQLEERRCPYDDCGSGLGVPVAPKEAAGPGDLRCVHCNSTWEPEY